MNAFVIAVFSWAHHHHDLEMIRMTKPMYATSILTITMCAIIDQVHILKL